MELYMEQDDLQEIEKSLSVKYLLVKRHSFLYFLGGLCAVTLAILGIGYQSIYTVLDEKFAKAARDEIQKKQTEFEQEMQAMLSTMRDASAQIQKIKEGIVNNTNISDEPLKIAKPVIFPNNVQYTMSYWSGGGNSAGPHFCNNPAAPEGFELIVKGQLGGRERPVCNIPPKHCNSAGEFCRNFVVSIACLINKDWHSWYKKYLTDNKLAYDIANVCRIHG